MVVILGLRMKVGYLTFGRADFSYDGIMFVAPYDVELYRVTPKTAKYVDVASFSAFGGRYFLRLIFCEKPE
jgi:hypothetical protein